MPSRKGTLTRTEGIDALAEGNVAFAEVKVAFPKVRSLHYVRHQIRLFFRRFGIVIQPFRQKNAIISNAIPIISPRANG